MYTLEQNVIIQNLENNKDTIQVNVFICYKACLFSEGSCAETLLLGGCKKVSELCIKISELGNILVTILTN